MFSVLFLLENERFGSDSMSLQDDIFNEFIEKLKAAQLPTKLIESLKKLWISGKLIYKDEIFTILKEACKNDPDKGN
jgi:hypothetical protein